MAEAWVRKCTRGHWVLDDRAVRTHATHAHQFGARDERDMAAAVASDDATCDNPSLRSLEVVDMTIELKASQLNHLVRRYLAGVSVKQLSEEFGVSRGAISLRLARAGVALRGRSDAEKVKWARIKSGPKSADAITRQCSAAWKAVRGSKRSAESLARAAATMAGRVRGVIPKLEADLLLLLAARGINARWQHPIGSHNVDLAVDEQRVAVEIQRQWPKSERSTRECSVSSKVIEHLLCSGWHVLIVFCPPTYRYLGKRPIPGTMTERFDCCTVADKLVAFCELARGLPSGRSQYGVIDGYGQPTSVRRLDLDGWARVPGF